MAQKITENYLEREALALQSTDWQQAFVELFMLHAPTLYQVAYLSLYHHSVEAEKVVENVFRKAYTHFHTFSNNDHASFKLYLYSLAGPMIIQRRSDLLFQQESHFSLSKRTYTEAERDFWHALQELSPQDYLIHLFARGWNISDHDVAMILHLDVHQVRFRWQTIIAQLVERFPSYETEVVSIFPKHVTQVQLSKSQSKRILKRVVSGPRTGVSFIQFSWWKQIMGPIPFGFAVAVVVITGATVAYSQRPTWLDDGIDSVSHFVFGTEPQLGPDEAIIQPSIGQRPSITIEAGLLPDVIEARRSLAEVVGNVYGTDYPYQRPTEETSTDEVKPVFTMNVPVNEYRNIDQAYIYAVPAALTEEQLQLAAFNHFASLPLNQFTFVNGTYYIPESATDYRPLFISFNADGSTEYQMRQAAICALTDLTTPTNETAARDAALAFLRSHNFIEGDEAQIQVTLLSEADKTVPKDTYCKNGDKAEVSDHQFAVFSPHRTLRYSDGPDDALPIRLRGKLIQLQSSTVTSMKIDPLEALLDVVVRKELGTLKNVTEATEDLQKFVYPTQTAQADARRFQRVFPQWDHQFGDARLKEVTITDVHLEYVFDNLNKLIEPYYIFSGTGVSASGEDSEIRFYVAASINDIELRAPNRE